MESQHEVPFVHSLSFTEIKPIGYLPHIPTSMNTKLNTHVHCINDHVIVDVIYVWSSNLHPRTTVLRCTITSNACPNMTHVIS